LLLLILAVGLTGCSVPRGVAPANAEIRVVKDDLGREVRLPATVERAVSLAPNLTEMVFAIGAGNKLVGDTTYCNYPEEAKAIQKVGDTLNPNMETIIALKPDVVLVSSASQLENFTKTLDQNGIAVYVTDPMSLKDVMKDLRQLGEVLGTEDQANKLAADLERRTEEIYDKLFHSPGTWNSDHVPVPTFVQISKEPLFTIGKQSFLTELLQYADGYSVTDDVESAYPKLSKETASALNPDAIILSDSPDNPAPNDALRNSPAVKNGRVYKVSADLLSRPGPRLVDAYEQIAKDLHPEKFQ
jgi:iron complex transport system substrate-binding protein